MILLAPSAPEAVRLADPPRPVPGAVRVHLTARATEEPARPGSFALCLRRTALAAPGSVLGPAPGDRARDGLGRGFRARIDGGWSGEGILNVLELLAGDARGLGAEAARLRLARPGAEEPGR
jgi:hypothetical protein